MRKVISIQGTQKKISKTGAIYYITYVTVDDGTEAEFWGRDIEVGTPVMIAYHYGKIKAIKKT